MKNCKICKTQTNNVFGIDFKAVPICEGCANVIFLQQAQWYVKQEVEKLNKPDVIGRSELLLKTQGDWLMANTSVEVEKIVDFVEHFKQ